MRQDTPTLRATAQNKLLNVISSAPTSQQRSAAANLLGVLVVTTPSIGDSGGTTQILTRAVQYFQEAIALNAGNTNAKENLELVLRLRRPGQGRFGHDASSGYGFGHGRGATTAGGGY